MARATAPPTLDRAIGRWSLAALTVNCVVGAGILGLPGRVFALAGPWTPWVLVAATALAIASALCLADLASRTDAPGGPVDYCRAAFGRSAGFAVGWLSWTATVLAAASLLNLFADLVAPGSRTPLILAAGAALTGFAMAGAGRSAVGGAALTVAKLALLAAVAVAGLIASPAPAAAPTGPLQPAAALVLLFFAFVGFERPTAIAGEAVEARAAMPLALIGGMAVVALLYAALFAACLRGVPDLAGNAHPIDTLALRIAGPAAAKATGAAAALIVLGTLVSQWITAPRLLLAMALDRTLPDALARLSPHRRTPDLAIAATGAIAVALALGGSFASGLAASSASRLLIFVACAGAVLRGGGTPSRFPVPGRRVIAAMVIAASLLLLVVASAELVRLAIILSIGGLIWLSTTLPRRRTRSA